MADYVGARTVWEQSEQAFRRKLKADQELFGSDHPRIVKTLNALAEVLHNLGHMQEARDYYDRVLELLQGIYGPDHPRVGEAHGKLGGVLYDLGDLRETCSAYDRELKALP
jgi:tetratricopeptide (TPR) repeat protein